MADFEHSGNGIPSSSVTITLGSTTSVLFLTPVNVKEQQNATTPTETENPAMGITVTTESNVDMAILHPAVIIGVPAVLLLILLILLVIFIIRCRNQKQSQQDELGSENGKSPIFEEDTPSVMEIEMEELDKWMNSLKRNEECDYLPPVKEEKDCNTNPSDCEP
ncbi:transmembrane protein 154 [Candoia aspera]|uniref:transmembrane protein 154 n=1 Tax=Candoia aspera TaxID=51853 RepID=UPI002FD7A8E8